MIASRRIAAILSIVSTGVMSGGARVIVSPNAGSVDPPRSRGSSPREMDSRTTRRAQSDRRLLGHPVLDQLDPAHQPEPAHVADDREVAERLEPRQEAPSHLTGALDEAFSLDDVDVREAHRAAHGMTGVGRRVHELPIGRRLLQRRVHALRHQDPAERQVGARDALCERHEVRFDAPVPHRKPAPGPPEAGDHLVGDQQHVVLGADLPHARPVATAAARSRRPLP